MKQHKTPLLSANVILLIINFFILVIMFKFFI